MNALKHGMCSTKSIALPHEDPELVQARNEAWYDYYDPASPAALHLVNLCVAATLKSDRAQRSHDAEVADQIDEADALWEKPRRKRLRALKARLAGDPAAAVAELEGFAHGCRWLIARWESLARALEDRGYWDAAELEEAVRLLGAQPEPHALIDNPVAYVAAMRSLRCHPSTVEGVFEAMTRPENRPPALRGIAPEEWLPGLAGCNALLREMISEKIDELTEAERPLGEADAAQRTRMFDRLSVLQDERKARLHLRYHAEARTSFHRAYKDLVTTLERDALAGAEAISRNEPLRLVAFS